MGAEYVLVDDGGQRHYVEDLVHFAPDPLAELGAELELALVQKGVLALDGGHLVVSAQQDETFGRERFHCEKIEDTLNTVVAPVHVVAQEEVVLGTAVRGLGPEGVFVGAQVAQIAVDVAQHETRRLDLDHAVLVHEDGVHFAEQLHDQVVDARLVARDPAREVVGRPRLGRRRHARFVGFRLVNEHGKEAAGRLVVVGRRRFFLIGWFGLLPTRPA